MCIWGLYILLAFEFQIYVGRDVLVAVRVADADEGRAEELGVRVGFQDLVGLAEPV